ncbi:MAG TPA: IreB family regulatory phosphoprotein [Thermoanaerobacterales bacterium]|nr:IreB family regulatory phosphoprotein [Thermoanaerobacterales bacterium]
MKYNVDKDELNNTRNIVKKVYMALEAKGYNPVNQIVGYLLSGDPAYITNYNNARSMIRNLERDELLEELVKYYINNK